MVREETNYLVDSLAKDLNKGGNDVPYGQDQDEIQGQELAMERGKDVENL